MNLEAIRTDLAAALTAAGFHAHSKALATVPEFPAAIVNPPSVIVFASTQGGSIVTIPVTIAANANFLEEAQKVLNAALSTDTPTSVYVAIAAATSSHWTKATATTVEGHRMVTEGANEVLAVDVLVDVYARR